MVRHGLSFIATLAFVASFFGARIFATLNPNVVIVGGGIHFHHFWYGIAMLTVVGWLAIAWNRNDRLDRIYALMYGLGSGFIGDEFGLLLTLGDYYSELTYVFFIGATSFIIIMVLLLRYGRQLEKDVIQLAAHERVTLVGIFIVGFATIFFAFGVLGLGITISVLGIALAFLGLLHHRWSMRSVK